MNERTHNHPVTGTILLSTMKQCPACLATMEEFRELVRRATPLYKERLAADPFYQNWTDKDWAGFIGSRVTEARSLIEAASSKGA